MTMCSEVDDSRWQRNSFENQGVYALGHEKSVEYRKHSDDDLGHENVRRMRTQNLWKTRNSIFKSNKHNGPSHDVLL